MAVSNNGQKIRIAISGGGIAGATLINALLKHEHLDVNIYESAVEFSERGAAVGISRIAQDALNEIGIADVLENAGAVPMNSSRAIMGCGPQAGTILFELAEGRQGKVVHRAALLSELLKAVPRDRMHTQKKLVSVANTDNGGVILYFEDGAEEYADALIGADGIHGYVREYILGAEHPAAKAYLSGFWDTRSLVPLEKAKEVLGEEYFKEPRQYGWCGDSGFLMHDWLDDGKTVQCVMSMLDENWSPEEWKRDLDRGKLEEAFSGWANSPVIKGMIELSLENPKLKAYAEWHHSVNAPTYAKHRVCIMGDAAHAMTPWQGAGAGQAIEDAMILETLLKEVTEPRHIGAAFKAYDEVRRPRTQKVVASSMVTGRMMFGREPEIGLDVEKMRAAIAPRWDFIYGFDLAGHKNAALTAMREYEGLKGA